MRYRRTNLIAAVTLMAVIFLTLFTGCCTKRDVTDLKNRLATVEAQNRETQASVARMDSLITASAESNQSLQNDVRYATNELTRQMTQLLENYNDLMTRLDQMGSQPQVIQMPLQSSTGAQPETVGDTTSAAIEPPPGRTPSIDCIDTYDQAFTQVRRGEYEEAIGGFRSYLAECGEEDDAPNAYYWVGECFYSQEKYTEALAEYQQLIDNFADSPNIGRALYKSARCQQELGKTAEAKALFQKLIDDFPGTLEAEQAAQRLKDL